MNSTIRADVYRIMRGKTVYITFILILLIAFLQVITGGEAVVGITMDETAIAEGTVYTGAVTSKFILGNMDILIYFIMPIFISVGMAMFSSGAVKNDISQGMSRVKIYLAKLILSSVLCLLVMISYLGSAVMFGTLLNGAGDWNSETFSLIGRTFAAQSLMLLACNSIGIFISFTIRKSGAVNGIYIAFFFVPMIIIGILSEKIKWLEEEVYNFDVTISIKLFSIMDELPSEDIIKSICVGVFYLIASTAAGILIFKRAEIK